MQESLAETEQMTVGEFRGLDAILALPAIDASVPLSLIFRWTPIK